MTTKTKRKYGAAKTAAVHAFENNLACPVVAKMFGVPCNSIYHAARRMGFKLVCALKPKNTNTYL